jgi:tRNA (guanine-N7-)-methyltransferase
MPKIRQHVNPFKSEFLSIPEVPRLEPPAGGFLEVELGSGESQFLIERSRMVPEARLCGVEIRREMVVRANRLCAEAGVTNVSNVFANMSTDLPRLFAPGTVRRFHINFPDPWWKSRQQKRRVVGETLIDELVSALEPAGEISLMTDIFEIALEGMFVLESDPGRFANLREPWRFYPRNPWASHSRRERQCLDEGAKIWRLWYRRVTPPTVASAAGSGSSPSPPSLTTVPR